MIFDTYISKTSKLSVRLKLAEKPVVHNNNFIISSGHGTCVDYMCVNIYFLYKVNV